MKLSRFIRKLEERGKDPVDRLSVDEEVDPSLDLDEVVDKEDVLDVLRNVSAQAETLIDDVMEINQSKEYSKLVKMLRSVARLADELIESEELLDEEE